MITTENVESLDKLTSVTTAFDSFAELCETCRTRGYVPTVYGDTRRKRILIRVLKARGLKVWGNKGKNW